MERMTFDGRIAADAAVRRAIASVRDSRSLGTDEGVYDIGAAVASIALAEAKAAALIAHLNDLERLAV